MVALNHQSWEKRMDFKTCMRHLLSVFVLGMALAVPAGANCGNNIYMDKCTLCGPTGMITEDRCKAVLENLRWNLEVLKRARCRLETYKDWRDGANAEASDKLDDLIEQIGGLILPGVKEGDGLASIPGKLNFAKKVIDLLEIQGTVVELLANSQGSSFFKGMIRSVRSEIWHLSREINRALSWYERNCPPLAEEEPFMEPLDPAPPEPEEEPETKKVEKEEGPDQELGDLPDYMRFFIEWVTRQGEVDLSRHQLSARQWEHALQMARPFGLVGFVQGVQEGVFDSHLGRHNLQVLGGLGLADWDVGYVNADAVWHFYNGVEAEEGMNILEMEEADDGHWRVIETEEERH
jgi:hypothetical protein